jgi:S1-C subfamily serine protease
MRLNKMVKVSVLYIISTVFMSMQAFAADPPAERRSSDRANELHRRYKEFIFSVNAYTMIKDADSVRWQQKIGTAFPINENGYLITLANVIKGSNRLRVVTSEGERVRARILGYDRTGNVAILKIDKTVSNIPRISPLSELHSGSQIFFLGVLPEMAIAVNRGIVGAINREDGSFEIDASGNPGTSGTPVFGPGRGMVGILAYQVGPTANDTASYNPSNKYIAISVEYASLLAESLIKESEGNRNWIGIGVNLHSGPEEGVIVERVTRDGPASKAGILPKDRIIEFDGKQITSPRSLFLVVRQKKPGDVVPVRIEREDRKLFIKITVDKRPAPPGTDRSFSRPDNDRRRTPPGANKTPSLPR